MNTQLQKSPKIWLLSTGVCVCCVCSVIQSYLTLCNPMDYSQPGSSVHGIFQTRLLEEVAVPPLGDLPDSGIKPVSLRSPALAGGLFTTSATWEAHPPLIHTPEGYCSLRLLWGIQQMAVLAV